MKDTTIQEALEANLSGVYVTEQAHRDMFSRITGGETMKRKMKVGFVLALVLLTLSVTAVAAAIMNRVFEQVIDMELEHGPFLTWSSEDRLLLLKLLDENGWDFPEDLLHQAYDENTDAERRAAIATKLITETFGREDALSHFTIIESVKGPMTTWSLEDKAWYTDFIRSRVDVLDTWRDVIPSETDMSVEDAVRIARSAIIEAYELAVTDANEDQIALLRTIRENLENDLASMIVDVSFFTTDDCDAPRWKIDFLRGPYGGSEYTVLLTRDGEVTKDDALHIDLPEREIEKRHLTDSRSPAANPAEAWSLQDKAAYFGSKNGLPAADEISEEQALCTAQAAMTTLGLDPTQYTPDVWYKLYDPYNASRQSPYYCVYFTDDPNAPCDVYCVIIDPKSGTVLETTHASENSSG